MKIFVLTFISSACFSSFSYASSSEKNQSFQISDMYEALTTQHGYDWRSRVDKEIRARKKSQILEIIMEQENRTSPDWQSDSDYPDRKKMIAKIHYLLDARKPDAPQGWKAKLPEMSQRLEETLYRQANSKAVYLNASTLKRRLQDLAIKIAQKTSINASINECFAKIEEMKSLMSFDNASEERFALISILKDKNQHQEDEIQEWCDHLEARLYASSTSRFEYVNLVGLELKKRIVKIAIDDANEAMLEFQEST